MKLTKVTVKNFKRFDAAEFDLQGNSVVLAGPNNAGKTTLLQAIATWSLALGRWLEMNDTNPRTGYVRAPMARQAFSSVPLLNFDMLWPGGRGRRRLPLEIQLSFEGVPSLTMEIKYNSTEQVYVRPSYSDSGYGKRWFRSFPSAVFVPAMGGVDIEEPVYQTPKIREMLGRGKPGDVLRNLLADVHQNTDQWEVLCAEVKSIFGYGMLPPNTSGAHIRAEYEQNGTTLDVSSAGSGFLQVLMLLAFLCKHKNAILLFDEPDAHLHILLQDRIYKMLKGFADESNSTLIMATHSERIINAAKLRDICVVAGKPMSIHDHRQRDALTTALTVLNNVDIALAQSAPGILYVEGQTDIPILQAWAEVLGHRLLRFLKRPLWAEIVTNTYYQGAGIQCADHFRAVKLVRDDICGFELRDSDGNYNPAEEMSRDGFARKFWRRYEIESYLVHPEALVRFVDDTSGQEEAGQKAREYLRQNFSPTFMADPMGEHDYLNRMKGKSVVAAVLESAKLGGAIDYSRIAAQMLPEEIHPDVVEMLNSIADHFGIGEQ